MADTKPVIFVSLSKWKTNRESCPRGGLGVTMDLDGGGDVGVETQSGSAKNFVVDQQSARLPEMVDDSRSL